MPRFPFRPLGIAAVLAAIAFGPAPVWAQAQPSSEAAPSLTPRDPSWDGAVKGALLGAGAMAGVLAIGYARCDAGCEAPAEGPMFAWGMSVGAGGGAAVGWLIDRLHVPRKTVPDIAIRSDKRERAVRLSWSF